MMGNASLCHRSEFHGFYPISLLTHKAAEAQRGNGAYPRSHSWWGAVRTISRISKPKSKVISHQARYLSMVIVAQGSDPQPYNKSSYWEMHRKMVLGIPRCALLPSSGWEMFTCPLSSLLSFSFHAQVLCRHTLKPVQPIELYSVSLPRFPEGPQMLMPMVRLLRGSPGKGGSFRHSWKQKRKLTPWRSYMIYPHIYNACLSFFLLARWSWSLHISSQ